MPPKKLPSLGVSAPKLGAIDFSMDKRACLPTLPSPTDRSVSSCHVSKGRNLEEAEMGAALAASAAEAKRREDDSSILIKVNKMSGEALETYMGVTKTGKDLKLHISKHWEVPSLCQKLLVEGEVLRDNKILADCCSEDCRELLVVLIVSVEEALQELRIALKGDVSERLEALNTCPRLQLTLDTETTQIIAAFLSNRDSWDIERMSIDVLGKASLRGDECAIEALLSVLRSPTQPLRLNAIQALSRVAPVGHRATCDVLLARAEDRDTKVVLAALEALSVLSQAGDEDCTTFASTLLQHQDGVIAKAAFVLLTKVAANDPELIAAARAVGFEVGFLRV